MVAGVVLLTAGLLLIALPLRRRRRRAGTADGDESKGEAGA